MIFITWQHFPFLQQSSHKNFKYYTVTLNTLGAINCLPMCYRNWLELRTQNEKRDNKQCLLDTPRRVIVNNKRLIVKSEKKYAYLQKPYGIIKHYKGK